MKGTQREFEHECEQMRDKDKKMCERGGALKDSETNVVGIAQGTSKGASYRKLGDL